jgi:hypothetical protein
LLALDAAQTPGAAEAEARLRSSRVAPS